MNKANPEEVYRRANAQLSTWGDFCDEMSVRWFLAEQHNLVDRSPGWR